VKGARIGQKIVAPLLLFALFAVIGTAPFAMTTARADVLFGTSGPDTIGGTDDDDIIIGKEGNDDISGEGGDDYIEGNEGNDEINDGPGSDNIFGDDGRDKIELEGLGEDGGFDGADEAHGEKGKDNIRSTGDSGFRVIFGGDDDDTISATGGHTGRIYGGTGDDVVDTCCDAQYDVWGGSGNDEIGGASECALVRVFAGSGHDRVLSPDEFTSGGPGNDIITFADCGGVVFGNSGNDQIAGGEQPVELHDGSGNDKLVGGFDDSEDDLFGDSGDDTLIGRDGADSFDCGPGRDTITDFDAAEGDTKTADCEDF
jgi:Ca2+-binding RTX toxin-like protein